jgi:modulator of FtsH protease HflK
MKRTAILITILLLAWFATGFFVVRGNEKAVVRRFGKVLRNDGGTVALRASGLHFDLPWPFSRVDRVNLSEVRTLTVGRSELEDLSDAQFLRKADPAEESRYLTGDKNVLNVKLGIQYRIAEEQVDAYLFGTKSPERRLRALADDVLSELMVHSGVDFAHTHGRSVIQELLTDRLREQALRQRLGIRVDTVTLEAVEPPLRVRAAFLDVNNARADKEKYINGANAYAAERREAARSDASQILDEASIFRRGTVEQARAEADSFAKLIAQFRLPDGTTDETARRIAMRRMYIETMEDVLRRMKVKVILQSGKPVDLTITRDPNR